MTQRHMYKQSDYDYEALGNALRGARAEKRLRQIDVAIACKTSRQSVWRCETGVAIDPFTLVRISAFLDVDYMQFNLP